MGLSSGLRIFIVFLGKTLNSHSAPLHPGVSMGVGTVNTRGTLQWTGNPSRGDRNIPRHCMQENGDTHSPWLVRRLYLPTYLLIPAVNVYYLVTKQCVLFSCINILKVSVRRDKV